MPALARKPLADLLREEERGKLPRELRLVDLTAIGIGSTVGSGVFSVIGEVAALESGPSVILCVVICSFGCLLTANAYIKLSQAIPSTGAGYAYAYHTLGEVFAVICASCLTLEYALCGCAVAVSWGNKFAEAIHSHALDEMGLGLVGVNWAAAVVCAFTTVMLLQGLSMGKTFTNCMTLVKVALVIFIIVCSLRFFHASNLSPLVPPPTMVDGKVRYGMEGLFRGSVDCFFAYVGFDEVCCLAGEAKDPRRDMPRAVMLSVLGTAFLTLTSAFGIVGMQQYADIDPVDGFEVGLRQHGWDLAARIINIGELVTLPVVVFISILPQARLFYAMAMDGLLPALFTRLSQSGLLFESNLLIGVSCTLLAMLLDFEVLNDTISSGVLLSFILCNCSLIMLTLTPEVPADRAAAAVEGQTGQQLRKCNGAALALYCTFAFLCMVLVAGLSMPSTVLGDLASAPLDVRIFAGLSALTLGLIALAALVHLCRQRYNRELGRVWLPAAAVLHNCTMLASLGIQGFVIIGGYFAVVLLLYFAYGTRYSARNHDEWLRRRL